MYRFTSIKHTFFEIEPEIARRAHGLFGRTAAELAFLDCSFPSRKKYSQPRRKKYIVKKMREKTSQFLLSKMRCLTKRNKTGAQKSQNGFKRHGGHDAAGTHSRRVGSLWCGWDSSGRGCRGRKKSVPPEPRMLL